MMRIACLADMKHPTPPPRYGGTQRVTAALVEELVRRGHDVTLYATGDSQTNARLVACTPRALDLDRCPDHERKIMIQLGRLLQDIGDFDVVHSHIDYFAFPFSRILPLPVVSTVHRRIDTPEMQEIYAQFHDVPLVAISRAQRQQCPDAQWCATIYHGLPLDHLKLTPAKEQYLAFLGRISPDKGPVQAIEIARRTGIPLKIAARISEGQRDYYEQVVKKQLDPGIVEFVGEIQDHEKTSFLGPAMALVFPVQWPEPFGLVLIEAMACGTPVLATRFGAIPEIVVDGQTGILGNSTTELIRRIDEVRTISPWACRQHVEKHFSVASMTDAYESLFFSLVGSRDCESRVAHQAKENQRNM